MPTRVLTDILGHEDDAPQWLVPGMIGRGQMVILAGEPGVGKSILSYTLALAVASGGLPFLGRQTAGGAVLYCDEENALPDLRQYLRWAWRGLGSVDPTSVALRLEHFSLAEAGHHRYEYLVKLADTLHPALIVLDTATPACGILDENDNAEASRSIRQLRRAHAAAGPECTILIIKHARIQQEEGDRRTIRGAKTWEGELDASIFHTFPAGRPPKDGLRPTTLVPNKRRAFGLQGPVVVQPGWVDAPTGRGLVLAGEWGDK